MKYITLLLSAILIAGCASQPIVKKVNIWDAADVSARVDVNYDTFTKLTSYEAPTIIVLEESGDNGSWRTGPSRVSAHAYKTNSSIQYIIFVTVPYYDFSWRNYSGVYDNDGSRYEINNEKVVQSCSVGGKCSYIESVSFSLTKKQLEKYIEKSPIFRMKGNRDFDFTIPRTYFEGFVDATSK